VDLCLLQLGDLFDLVVLLSALFPMRQLEARLGFEAHQFLLEQRGHAGFLRRWVWLVLLSALRATGSAILGLRFLLILIAIVAQIAFLVVCTSALHDP